MSDAPCDHLASIESPRGPATLECVECVKTGDRWVNLRTCQSCGLTHCCDSSPNKHATKHHGASGHPVVASAKPGERWLWCFEDEEMVRY